MHETRKWYAMEHFIENETITSSSINESASTALLLHGQDTPTWWHNSGELKEVVIT